MCKILTHILDICKKISCVFGLKCILLHSFRTSKVTVTSNMQRDWTPGIAYIKSSLKKICILLRRLVLHDYNTLNVFSHTHRWVGLLQSGCVRRHSRLRRRRPRQRKLFTFSTSSPKPLNRFTWNFVEMFLGWSPTKFVQIGVLPFFFLELWAILCNFLSNLKKSSSTKPLVRFYCHLVVGSPKGLDINLLKSSHCDLI